jgi:pimeloyl-ACP methyl ester carboxylesterase
MPRSARGRAAARAFFSIEPPRDLITRIARLTAPVLVLAGAQDCLTGLAPVIALAKVFTAGRIVVIDRCAHYPSVEQPAAFRKAVDPFLDEVKCVPATTAVTH